MIGQSGEIFEGVYRLRDFRSRRASSWDRSGGNRDWITIGSGAKATLLHEEGPGCVRHFYWTYIDPDESKRLAVLRGLVLLAYWEGATEPCIAVPLGDFFGVSNGQIRPLRSLAFTTNAGFGKEVQSSWGFNCYLPMPFRQGARIELENQADTDVGRLWFHIDYEVYEPGTRIDDSIGLLHAVWNRENPTERVHPPAPGEEIKNASGEDNYVILATHGNGQFAGYFLTVVNHERDWYGEGDDMIFIDGESYPPSIHGTGTEEIFGGGASPTEEYSGPYTGFHCIENRAGYRYWGTNGMYRFYLTDPLRFRRSIRVTLEHGHGNDRANDYSSVAFWYQQGVNERMPTVPPPEGRSVNFQD